MAEIQTPIEDPTPQSSHHFHLPWWVWVSILIVMAFGVGYHAWSSSLDESVDSDYEACIQVITPARNPQTGEVREFPTPCDVPAGWEKIEPEVMDHTAGWETHHGEQFGFEFQYPGNWIVTKPLRGDVEIKTPDFDPVTGSALGSVMVRALSVPDGMDIQSWLNFSVSYFSRAEIENINKSLAVPMGYEDGMVTIAGVEGFDQYISEQNRSSRYVYLQNNLREYDQIIVVIFTSPLQFTKTTAENEKVENLLELFNQILSTVKLIEPQLASDWKIYENTKNGYVMQVPSSWFALSLNNEKCMHNVSGAAIVEFSKKRGECGFFGEFLPHNNTEITVWVNHGRVDPNVFGAPNKEIIVGGERAAVFYFTDKSELPNVQAARIYFNHGTRGYIIFLKQTDRKGNYDPLYDQILSTFRFIE